MAKSGFAAGQLRSLIERIERLEEEKAALTADIREVYSEAKGNGFDTKIMRQVVRMRKLDKADRQETGGRARPLSLRARDADLEALSAEVHPGSAQKTRQIKESQPPAAS